MSRERLEGLEHVYSYLVVSTGALFQISRREFIC
jgi:hypothetical protein